MIGRRHAVAIAVAALLAATAVFYLLVLAEDDPPADAASLPAGCVWDLPYVVCTYSTSTALSFDTMVADIEGYLGRQVASTTPVWLQAWGGGGGNGGEQDLNSGGNGGDGGYAQTVQTAAKLDGQTLYLYVANGGTHSGVSSGQGGASTLIATQQLSRISSFPGGLIAVAGGGGGGGQGCFGAKGGGGGNGGSAVAYGGTSSTAGSNGRGYSGNQGQGGNTDGHGAAGATGGGDGTSGTAGLGGLGGAWTNGSSAVGWNNVTAIDSGVSGWVAGHGGKGAGGGGGGYGGGGGAQGCSSGGSNASGGGGGGGSYAIAPAASDGDASYGSQIGAAAERVKITFNLTS